jgi:hypothetical protein
MGLDWTVRASNNRPKKPFWHLINISKIQSNLWCIFAVINERIHVSCVQVINKPHCAFILGLFAQMRTHTVQPTTNMSADVLYMYCLACHSPHRHPDKRTLLALLVCKIGQSSTARGFSQILIDIYVNPYKLTRHFFQHICSEIYCSDIAKQFLIASQSPTYNDPKYLLCFL